MSDKVTINDPASAPTPEAVGRPPAPAADAPALSDLHDAGIVNLLAIAAVIAGTPKAAPVKVSHQPVMMPDWPKAEAEPVTCVSEPEDAGTANLLAIAAVVAATPKRPLPVVVHAPFPMLVWPSAETNLHSTRDATLTVVALDSGLRRNENLETRRDSDEVGLSPVAVPKDRQSPPHVEGTTADASPTSEATLRAPAVDHATHAPTQSWPRRMLRYAGIALAGYATLMLALIVLFRFLDPPGSALMVWRSAGGTDINRTWVPISNISPNLVRAVIVAEDWTFCAHHGVDVAAMQEAIEKAGDGIPRGASTISMQTVKNVFLWPSKSYVRKAIELPMTLVMELLWPKRRVLEVYLNVAEWGPGIFGAEAASRHHFNKSASKLTSREAAQLAASLPNPFVRDAGDPGPRLARKATTIQNRMRIAGSVTDCVGIASDSKAP